MLRFAGVICNLIEGVMQFFSLERKYLEKLEGKLNPHKNFDLDSESFLDDLDILCY